MEILSQDKKYLWVNDIRNKPSPTKINTIKITVNLRLKNDPYC